MRRPAPLPASPEEPAAESVEHAPGRAGRSGRWGELFRGASASAHHDELPASERGDATVTRTAESGRDGGHDSMHDSAADSSSGGEQGTARYAVRSSEVWRAARARRKALRAEIRRFTQRSRRRRITLWGSVGGVAAVVLASVIAAYSPLFAVEKVTVIGATSVDPATVQQALADQVGAPLALVDASAVKSALTAFPIIESYALEARPPHELRVRIVERTPVGAIRSDAGYSVVDAAGVVLSTTPEKPEGRPELDISGGIDSTAFHSAGLVMRSLPADLRARVAQVHATSGEDVTLRLDDGTSIVWGSEKDSVRKAAVLVRLIAAAPDARTFDVSSPTVPVVG